VGSVSDQAELADVSESEPKLDRSQVGSVSDQAKLAERVGFEPTVGFLPRALSKGVP
jgi:hypothetical protein